MYIKDILHVCLNTKNSTSKAKIAQKPNCKKKIDMTRLIKIVAVRLLKMTAQHERKLQNTT